MPPLRILHVVPYFEHAWAYGGIPRVATTLTHGLARRGHDVTVCTTDACDAVSRVREPHTPSEGPGRLDVHMFRNLSNSLAYRWQLFTPIGFVRALRAVLPRIDIGHLHACRNLPVAAAARLLAAARIPYVVSPHGTAPLIERRLAAKRIFDATVGRGYLEGAARVVAVSDAERRQLLDLGVPRAAHPPSEPDRRTRVRPRARWRPIPRRARLRRRTARAAPLEADAPQGRRHVASRLRVDRPRRHPPRHRRQRHGLRDSTPPRSQPTRASPASARSPAATVSTPWPPPTSWFIRRRTRSSVSRSGTTSPAPRRSRASTAPG